MHLCKRQRYYFVADLRKAFGNIECGDVVDVARLHCRNCDGKGSLDFRLGRPPSDIADKAWLRRIDRIEYKLSVVRDFGTTCDVS
jgi:hypothetical protein